MHSSLTPKEQTQAFFSGLKNSLSSVVETGKKEGVDRVGGRKRGKLRHGLHMSVDPK